MGDSQPKRNATNLGVILLAASIGATGAFYFARANRELAAGLPAATAVSSQTPTLLHLEPFVMNLADDEHTFLRIGVDLGVQGAVGAGDKKNKGEYSVVIARDTILGVVTALHSQQLVTAEDRQRLKKELKEALNARVPELGVREVYFTEFLLQR